MLRTRPALPWIALVTAALLVGGAWLLFVDARTRAERAPPADAVAATSGYEADGRYAGPPPTAPARPNLILLLVDSLRADCLGRGAAGDEVDGDLPYLARLARRGLACRQVTAPAPSTLPALTSLLTGLLPDRHRVDHGPYPPVLSAGVTTFTEALGRGHGFETFAVTPMVVPPARLGTSPWQGFQGLRTAASLAGAREHVRAWNRRRAPRRPFFLLVHTEETSAPYGVGAAGEAPSGSRDEAPEDLDDAQFLERYLLDGAARTRWSLEAPRATTRRAARCSAGGLTGAGLTRLAGRLERAYRGGVRALDGELRTTIELLEAEGLLENTVLVIAGLHGEAFGEHGLLGNGRILHDEVLHVPLVALGPDEAFAPGRSSETGFGLVDLLPTFFELGGLPPLAGIEGRSMLAPLREDGPGRAVLSLVEQTTFSMGRHASAQLVSVRSATETFLLTFDLAAGTIVEQYFDRTRDPRELHDLTSDGRLGELPVGHLLAPAIERARDRVWQAVASGRRHVQLGYGAGVGTVTSQRPAPARVRAP